MKTKERLLFMALGGLLVLAGMIVGQFVFSTAQAQDRAQDATFKTVKCERLFVGDSLNHGAVMVASRGGNGAVFIVNKAKEIAAMVATDDGGGGLIQTYSDTGKKLVTLSGGESGGGLISVNNTHGVEVVGIQANKSKDGVIGLFDRYGDLGWGMTGKQ